MADCFEIDKFLGKWYELAHYPTWFQRNDLYNTTAEYTKNQDGSVHVLNKTYSKGEEIASKGTAHLLAPGRMHVDFDRSEMMKIINNPSFRESVKDYPPMDNSMMDPTKANYVIDRIWVHGGHYKIMIVTNDKKDSFWLLSRHPAISARLYGEIMCYVTEHYCSKKFVATPHYPCH